MKLNKTLFLTAATIGFGTAAHAESGDSLNVAIGKLLSDGCGATSSGRLINPSDFTPSDTTLSNFREAELQEFVVLRQADDAPDDEENDGYVWVQTGGYVDRWEDNQEDLFSIVYFLQSDPDEPPTLLSIEDLEGLDDAPTASEIGYRLQVDLPDDGFGNIDPLFDPQEFDDTTLTFRQGGELTQTTDTNEENFDDNTNFIRVEAEITQLVDLTTTYTPNVMLGTQLAQFCSRPITQSDVLLSGTYDIDFSFNDAPGINGAGGGGLFAQPASGSTASPTGLAAIQAQETVSRRRGGFLATIKRLLAKAEREEEEERRQALRPYQVASLTGTGSPYVETDTSSSSLFFDASIGMINLERDPSDLEGGYSADTMFANLGAGFSFNGPFAGNDLAMIGVTGSYENTESDSADPTGAGMTAFETEASTIGGFIAWSSEVVGDASNSRSFNATLAAAHGNGDQTYVRQFDFGNTSNLFDGDLDQNFTSVSFQAGMSQRFGNITFAPRVAVNHVQFETDAYSEDFASGGEGDPGLAFELEYDGVDDEWTEFKIGAVTAIDGDLGTNSTWELAFGADAVFVDDSETPDRTAFFVQDLRTGSARTPIIYSVSDLDDQYYDLSASVTMSFNDRVQPYARVFSRQGYEFVEANGAALGIRLVY